MRVSSILTVITVVVAFWVGILIGATARPRAARAQGLVKIQRVPIGWAQPYESSAAFGTVVGFSCLPGSSGAAVCYVASQ
jgi:hypothetical protein